MQSARLIAAVAVALTACGSTAARDSAAPAAADPGDTGAAMAELRYRIGSNPRDFAAHVQLARLQEQAGLPGAALRHYSIALRNAALPDHGRARLGRLLHQRGMARVGLADAAAIADYDAAERLGVAVGSEQRLEALWLAVGGSLRAGQLAAAQAAIRRADLLSPGDPRAAILAPEAADTGPLGVAAAWAWQVGARRHGARLLDAYADRFNGRLSQADPLVMQHWIEARSWWRGQRHGIGLLQLEALAKRGVEVCIVAASPQDYGCARTALARIGGPSRWQVWSRARRRYWRTGEPALASVWAARSLEAFLDQQIDDWLPELAELVDADGLVEQLPRSPLFAQPALWLAVGQPEAAQQALANAVLRLSNMTAPQRALLLAAAGRLGSPVPILLRIDGDGQADPVGWLAVASVARVRGDEPLEQLAVERAGTLADDHWAGVGDVASLAQHEFSTPAHRESYARWYAALRASKISVPRPAHEPPPPMVPFGLPVASDPLLAAAINAYGRDKAVSDRLVQQYMDQRVAIGSQAPAVIRMYLQLGDADRAVRWAQRWLEESSEHPRALFMAAEAAAAAGDSEAAEVFVGAGAALSGWPGQYFLRASEMLARRGHTLPALGFARLALQHTAEGEQQEVMLLIADLQQALGRRKAAATTLAEYLESIPLPFRPRARGDLLAAWGAEPPPVLAGEVQTLPLTSSLDESTQLEGLDPAAATELLDQRIARHPRDIQLRAERMRLSEPGSAVYHAQLAQLLAFAVTNHGKRRQRALRAVAAAAQRAGAFRLARAATAELSY